MAEEKREQPPSFPFAEMIALWQKMMLESFEAMVRTPAFTGILGKALEGSNLIRDQVEKGLQASLRAMNLPTAEDLRRMTEGLALMQAQLQVVQDYLKTVERAVKLQEEWRKRLDETIQKVMTAQVEGQKAFETWTKQVEDRFQGLQRFWEESAKQWEEGLRQALAFGQTSQRSLEELNKTVWDISKQVFGR